MTKESIIIAALRLFLVRGYKSVSLLDVANELGITKGGIYHYFSSKDDLLRTSFHFLLDRFQAKYTDLLSDKHSIQQVLQLLLVDDIFEGYAKELFGLKRECRIDHMHFAIEIMRLFPDIQEKFQQSQVLICEAFAQKIQAAVEQGELSCRIDSYALAANILSLVNGQKTLGTSFRQPDMRKRMMDNVWVLLNT